MKKSILFTGLCLILALPSPLRAQTTTQAGKVHRLGGC